ncbi:MAG: Gldg family protein [Treponema sp.]|nr:Gldg family protein [Treponema sp.]
MKKILNWLKSSSSDFVLFIILIVLVNIIGQNLYFRVDLTEPKSYSLSKASVNIVKNLDEPLSIRVFFDKNLPPQYSSVAQYAEDFLEEYKSAANKNLTVNYMDLSKKENVELAQSFGLRQVQIQEVKNNEVGFKQAFMGIVISYGDSVELIDPISSADGLEYKITSTISKMINTNDTLAALPKGEKIRVTVYLTEALKQLRINGVDQIEKIVENAYREVNKQKQDRLEFNVVHPTSEETDELVTRYSLQSLSFRANGRQEKGTVGVVIESGDNFRVLPIEVQQSIFGFAVVGLEDVETTINESIQSLMSKPTQVGYILGHNELPLDEEKYAANFQQLISSMYELVTLDLSTDSIPATMSSIIINGPQFDYTEEELYKVDQFIMRGGNVMFLIDGLNTTGAAAYYSGTPQYQVNEVNLDRLLNKYGVKRGNDFVFDENCYTQANQQYGKLNFYWAPLLQKKQLAKNHPITKNLGYVIMLQNGSLDITEAQANKDFTTTVLARSSDKSWISDRIDIVLNPLMITPPADPSGFKSQPLAVLLEGRFESAFDEAPVPEKNDDEDNEEEEKAAPAPVPASDDSEITSSTHIAKSRVPGKIFIASTSYITTYQVLDTSGTSPISMFLMNTVDYMNGNEDLCIMRSKGLSINTLEIKSQSAAKTVQYFNEWGLAVLFALVGLIVLRLRVAKKARINKKYNPDDTRFVTKSGKENTQGE